MHVLLKYALAVAGFYLAYCLLLFIAQRHIMFPRYLIATPQPAAQKSARFEEIWLETKTGKIEAWFLPPFQGRTPRPAPAVIFGHGNGELIDFWPDELKTFNDWGIGLLLVEYPGYGRSAGRPSQDSITETFVAAYDLLTSRKDIDASRIILFGRSLGGGAVCALAAKRPSKALILMSTFSSVRYFATRYLVPAFLIRDPFDNLALVASYAGPILIVHGKHDEIIPFSHGIALHKAARQGKFIEYDAGHNDCPPNWDVFWQNLEVFLREIGIADR